MAADQDLFFPGSKAIAVGGRSVNGVRFEDLNVDQILSVIPKTWTDDTQTVRNVFEVNYQEHNKMQPTQYLFTRSGAQSIDDMLAIIEAEATSTNFRKYTAWRQINRRPIGTEKDILLNDDHIENRIWRVAEDETDVYLAVKQSIDKEIYTFGGDQSTAKTYYYAY